MAMAAAVTLASPRLFSLLNIMLLVKSKYIRGSGSHYPWFSSWFTSRSSTTCQARVRHAPSAECHRTLYIRRKDSLRRTFSSLCPIESGFALLWRERYSIVAGGVLPPHRHISSVPSRSAGAEQRRLVLLVWI